MKIRNKYIHPSQRNLNVEKDALLALTRLTDISQKLYGRDETPTESNQTQI